MRFLARVAASMGIMAAMSLPGVAQMPTPEQTACEKLGLRIVRKDVPQADRVFLAGESTDKQARPRPVDIRVGDRQATLELAGIGTYRDGAQWWDFGYQCLLADAKTALTFTIKDPRLAKK